MLIVRIWGAGERLRSVYPANEGERDNDGDKKQGDLYVYRVIFLMFMVGIRHNFTPFDV
jgi:hypothetical protein